MDQIIQETCRELFRKWSGQEALTFTPLPPSGSDRHYYRLQANGVSAIAAHNTDKKENNAFLSFSRHFRARSCRVPEIYEVDKERDIYLLEDLGDITLFSLIDSADPGSGNFPDEISEIYRKVVKALPEFQVTASRDLDYSVCYPRSRFDRQSMMWDLNYFKYYFLKLAKVPFDEQDLENDFQTFCDFLLESPAEHFLYRDFQSRNVMIRNGEPWFIDYQGGRKGALQYDLASLLYDAKAHLPQALREELLELYIRELSEIHPVNVTAFRDHYYGFVLIRIMQAMGAYGFRGFYEKKSHFLQSIPYALDNLEWILDNIKLPVGIPALWKLFRQLTASRTLREISTDRNRLQVVVTSFSYKRGIPVDYSGHGGGFVFDCRPLENPGKLEQFRDRTGLDPDVAAFLANRDDVGAFWENVRNLAELSVKSYTDRNFSHLMLNFGCTGGQHRSVYFADRLAKHLKKTFDITVRVQHIEQDMRASAWKK